MAWDAGQLWVELSAQVWDRDGHRGLGEKCEGSFFMLERGGPLRVLTLAFLHGE